jgi:hypothetical protein
MKNQSNSILNIPVLLIIISIIIIIYFGYEIINPIITFINTEIEVIDNISVVVNFFK